MRNCILGVLGPIMICAGFMGTAHSDEPVQLTDAQLDATTAGITFAAAIGDGVAQGSEAGSRVDVRTMVGLGNEANTVVTGQAESSASSPGSSAGAMASSRLTLFVVIP